MSHYARWLLLAFALVAATLAQPKLTQAHALLDHADPPADSVLKQTPAQLTLYFTQALVPANSWVMLRDASGKDTDLGAKPDGTKVLKATTPQLAAGAYTVRWQTQSADDDDYAQGSYKLTVANADGSTPSTSSSSTGSGISPIVYVAIAAFVAVDFVVAFFVIRRRSANRG